MIINRNEDKKMTWMPLIINQNENKKMRWMTMIYPLIRGGKKECASHLQSSSRGPNPQSFPQKCHATHVRLMKRRRMIKMAIRGRKKD